MPPCRVAEADLARVDLLEQLQRLAAVLHQDVRRRSGALDLDVVEGLIVVAVPVGVALLVTDTLLIAIAARGGRREAWHTFFSPSKRPIATLEEEQTCRWRTAVVRLSASLVVPRRSAHPTTRFMGRRPDGDAAPPEREGENLRPALRDDQLRSSSGVHKCSIYGPFFISARDNNNDDTNRVQRAWLVPARSFVHTPSSLHPALPRCLHHPGSQSSDLA